MENFKIINDFNVGDKVVITEAQYQQGDNDIAEVGKIGYVTFVGGDGCMIARYPDYDPDTHDENSLFFLNGGFKHVD